VDDGVDTVEGIVVHGAGGGVPGRRREIVGPAGTDEPHRLVAFGQEATNEGFADEAGGSTHEYAHGISFARVV